MLGRSEAVLVMVAERVALTWEGLDLCLAALMHPGS